jgi:2,3-bisphosphoglycerate-dependent phosphoglycerate mutase
VTRDLPTSPSTPSPPAEPPVAPPPANPMDRAFLTNTDAVTELVLVRHGQQDFPTDVGRATTADWVDPPLSAVGIRQADAVGRSMVGETIGAVYASNLERALETGRQIARHHELEVTVLPELREVELFRDVPEGTTLLDAVDPILLRGARERWVRDRRWDVYPYSETGDEFRHRVLMAVEGIVATHPGQRVVVACHGGVINAVTASILGVREDMFFRPAHASVHRVAALDERRVIWSLNETHHLAAVDPALVTW